MTFFWYFLLYPRCWALQKVLKGRFVSAVFITTYLLLSSCTASIFSLESLKKLRVIITRILGIWLFTTWTALVPSGYGTAKEEPGQCSPVWRRPKEMPWNLSTFWPVSNSPIPITEWYLGRWPECFCYISHFVAHSQGEELTERRSRLPRLSKNTHPSTVQACVCLRYHLSRPLTCIDIAVAAY